jgi:hypothetical protein
MPGAGVRPKMPIVPTGGVAGIVRGAGTRRTTAPTRPTPPRPAGFVGCCRSSRLPTEANPAAGRAGGRRSSRLPERTHGHRGRSDVAEGRDCRVARRPLVLIGRPRARAPTEATTARERRMLPDGAVAGRCDATSEARPRRRAKPIPARGPARGPESQDERLPRNDDMDSGRVRWQFGLRGWDGSRPTREVGDPGPG